MLHQFLFHLGLVAILCAILAENSKPRIEFTGDQHDITVMGKGGLVCIDPENEERLLCRACRLHLNDQGQLAMRFGCKEWLVEPAISIPSCSTSMIIQSDGQVYVSGLGTSLTSVGQLQIGYTQKDVGSPNMGEVIHTLTNNEQIQCANPGLDGAGFIHPGWKYQRWGSFSISATLGMFGAYLCIAYALKRFESPRTANRVE